MNKAVIDSLLEAAITAPSGHNTQPWFFEIADDCIRVLPDFSRRLPALDPDDRELYISIGCVIENICIAATQYRLSCNVKPYRHDGVEISLKEEAGSEVSPLAAAIPQRHTNRNLYDATASLPSQVVGELEACGAKIYMRQSPEFEIIRNGVVAANKVIYGNSQNKNELKGWIRYNSRETHDKMDGLGYDVLEMPGLPAWISRAATSVALNASIQSRSDVKKLMSAACVALFASCNDIAGWIECGRHLQRFLLTAALRGVACAFVCQPCEVESVAASIALQLGVPSRPQVLLRLGYAAPPPAYSRRRPLESFKK